MLVPGGLLGNYRIEGELGRGGMGVVFRARDERLERDVAIKALPEALKSDADRLDRFRREARTVAQLSHPHIAQIHHLIEEDGQTFLVLELVKGKSLAEVLEHKKLDQATALRLAAQIAGALEAAHAKGVIHRDLKPGNVMIAEDGSARVLDFGLAVMRSNASTWVSDETIGPGGSSGDKVVGTPGYMSPEQARGEMIDQRADLFSFGCLLYELLARRPAYEGKNHAARLTSTLTTEPDLRLAKAPPAVISMLEACLAKAPHRRLSSAAEARRILETALDPDASRSTPPAEAPKQHPTNLRAAADRFIGHADDLRELGEIVQHTRLVTLTGAGGCGKTRLASELGQRVLEDFPGGVWMVELASVTAPEFLVQAVAGVLDVKEEPLEDGISRRLSIGPALLILDNCEHLLEPAGAFLDWLLSAAPSVRLMATSREPLGITGEKVWRIRNLTLPPQSAVRSRIGSASGTKSASGSAGPANHGSSGSGTGSGSSIAIDDLLASESVALFVDRAKQVQPAFELTPHNAMPVASICARLDGIPLAIELAAARVKVLTPEQLEDKLADRFRVLRAGRGRTERHQTLRATLDWSYQLLHEDERKALRALSVFVGGCTLEAATYVLAGPEGDEFETLDLLTNLIDKSLLLAEARGHVARYRMLESVRIFALEELVAAGEASTAQDRHLDFFGQMAQRFDAITFTATQTDLDRLEQDHENLIEAIQYAAADKRHVRGAMAICFGVRVYWTVRMQIAVMRLLLEMVYNAPGAPDHPEEYGLVCWMLGQEKLTAGQLDDARKLSEKALQISDTHNLTLLTLLASGSLGFLLTEEENFQGALERWAAVLKLARQLGDRPRERQAFLHMGQTLLAAERYAEAEASFVAASQLLDVNSSYHRAQVNTHAARAAAHAGSPERACSFLQQALAAAEAQGAIYNQLFAVGVAAELAEAYGENERCARWLGHFVGTAAQHGLVLTRREQVVNGQMTAHLKSAMTLAAFEQAYNQGKVLNLPIIFAEVQGWVARRLADTAGSS